MKDEILIILMTVAGGYLLGCLIVRLLLGRPERRRSADPQPVRAARKRLKANTAVRRRDVLDADTIADEGYGVLEAEELL